MADDPTPPTTPFAAVPAPSRWGSAIVGAWSMALLGAALAFAYLTNNQNMLVVLISVIATNATTVVGFYVGSSASSQAKDATISNQLPK